jgi:SAM-dependent methyltransferase
MTSFSVGIVAAGLRRAIKACDPNTVLDIGCGSGWYSFSLRDCYTTYIGLEPSDIPQDRRLCEAPPRNVLLVHNDPVKPLPVADASIEMALFLASYDHIPNRRGMLEEVWRVLRPGGFILITMTNYGFWAKRLLNVLSGQQLAKAEHDHFCVHDPRTLEEEVLEFTGAKLVRCDADDIYLPNSRLRLLYRSQFLLGIFNRGLRFLVHDVLACSNSGSTMTLVFQKPR